MNTYHPDLYQEILKDYQWRYPKFCPDNYPKITIPKPNLPNKDDNQ